MVDGWYPYVDRLSQVNVLTIYMYPGLFQCVVLTSGLLVLHMLLMFHHFRILMMGIFLNYCIGFH